MDKKDKSLEAIPRHKTLKVYLQETLQRIIENDTNYQLRKELIYRALFYASNSNFETGIRIDPNEPEWPVIYIELPTGQVSWHMPQHEKEYDGHSTEEKFKRIREFCDIE